MTNNPGVANADGAVCLCTWQSGSLHFVANYGSTIINGSTITTGSITADRLVVGSITGTYIAGGTITADKMGVTSLSAITANIGLLRTATSGARQEIATNYTKIFDSSNVKRFSWAT